MDKIYVHYKDDGPASGSTYNKIADDLHLFYDMEEAKEFIETVEKGVSSRIRPRIVSIWREGIDVVDHNSHRSLCNNGVPLLHGDYMCMDGGNCTEDFRKYNKDTCPRRQ